MQETVNEINVKIAVMDEQNKAIMDRFGKVEGAITELIAQLATVLAADHQLIQAYIKVFQSSRIGPARGSLNQTCDYPSPPSKMESAKTSLPTPTKQPGKPGLQRTKPLPSS